jgi:hyperosmotically inducible protein
MKTKLAIGCIAISALLVPVLGYTADSDSSHPGTFVKDSVVTSKIKTKLAAEHLASLTNIKVDTDRDGVVWLSGTVNNQREADKAVSLARDTDGARSVKSDIKVKMD